MIAGKWDAPQVKWSVLKSMFLNLVINLHLIFTYTERPFENRL